MRYFFGKPKLHPNSIIHSSLYYMTNFSIAGCLKIKTIATTKTIIYLFIYLFILESRRRKLKSKMADKRQYGGFVSQDEDGLLLWTYGTMRPFLFYFSTATPDLLLWTCLWHNTLANWATKLGHLGCYEYNKP